MPAHVAAANYHSLNSHAAARVHGAHELCVKKIMHRAFKTMGREGDQLRLDFNRERLTSIHV